LILAILAVTSYWTLRAQIRATRSVASIVELSGRQRVLLQKSVLLSQELAKTEDAALRASKRQELRETIQELEAIHHSLVRTDAPPDRQPPPEVLAIYNDSPWLLDSEVRNFVAQARTFADVADENLSEASPHLRYLRTAAESTRLAEGLQNVVAAYVAQGQAKSDRLQTLSFGSLICTLVVLILAGVAVFRPMVHRVRADMRALQSLNETLDSRVQERTALAVRRADELAASEAALRDSEALYRSLVDHLPMCVLRKNLKGQLLFVNERFCQMQGRTSNELLGLSDEDLYPPALASKYRRDDETVIKSDRVLHGIEEHQTPGGQVRFVEILKSPVRDAQNNVIGTQTAFWDVTDRRQAEQRALQAERLAAIGQMVTGVAHESRNALQQIQACSKMLEWEVEDNCEAQTLIADLQSAQSRLLRLFEDLRGYAAPMQLELRRSDLLHAVDAAWDATTPMLNGKQATIHKHTNAVSAYCQIDAYKMEQVFRNLFENAVAACEEPMCLAVRIDSTRLDESPAVQITVSDNGPGLTSEQQSRMFEAFYTTKSQGSGLGMAIVKRIVEAHQGTIEAGNGSDGGAEFIITLPRGET
jgi:PAS domain S-box-containing protein